MVNEFLVDFKRWSRLRRFAKKTYFNAFNMVLANLLAVHYSSSQLLLSRSNGRHKNGNPVGIDNRTISPVTEYLADRGFIDLHIGNFHWFIFNIADIFITFGIICLILVEIFSKNMNKENNAKNI